MNNTPEQMRTKLRQEILPAIDLRPFVNGGFSSNGLACDQSLKVVDPFTGMVMVEMPIQTEQTIDEAVDSAAMSFDSGEWSNTAPEFRADCLNKLADIIEDRQSTISLIESSDTGRLLKGVQGWDLPHSVEVFRYYANLILKNRTENRYTDTGQRIEVRDEPIGPCALIIPWNFPFVCMAWKMAPALGAGCTIVVKTPERTPLSGQYLASMIEESGFPPGVVNIVSGAGTLGARLTTNPKIKKISFTGSPEVAKSIIQSSAKNFPSLTLELGGKSPNLVFEDADIVEASRVAVDGMFGVAGQNCCAGSRLIVQESIMEEFVDNLIRHTRDRTLGDPMDSDTKQGPQVDKEHVHHINSYVEDALSKGAKCHIGGESAGKIDNFYLPTIVSGVGSHMKMDQEEIFGPVGAIYTFKTENEGFSMANNTRYGLAAGIWTSDQERIQRFLKATNAGTCWVNSFNAVDINAPWGGQGLSGYGRELGEEGLEEFLQKKSIFW